MPALTPLLEPDKMTLVLQQGTIAFHAFSKRMLSDFGWPIRSPMVGSCQNASGAVTQTSLTLVGFLGL